MALHDLKKELISYIENTNDEEFLSLLKEDLVFYGKIKYADITGNLTEHIYEVHNVQKKKIEEAREQIKNKQTLSDEQANKDTDEWLSK